MKQTVDFQTFRDAFRAYDRLNTFSREGMELIFNYLEELERDTGEDLELDVIAVCCDYAEDTAESLAQSYSIDLSDCDPEDDEAVRDTVVDYLQDQTAVIGTTSGGIVYAQF